MNQRILIVADDLTGANAVAARFVNAGYRALTVPFEQFHGLDGVALRFDVVVVNTNSRHAEEAVVAERVKRVVETAGPVRMLGIRIDSTLRGGIGAAIRSALNVLEERSKARPIALCVPAHPEAGRHTVNGRQSLDGVELEFTHLAKDPLNPTTSSDVLAIVRRGGIEAGRIDLEVVTSAPAELVITLTETVTAVDVVVLDATKTFHLRSIAQAAAQLIVDRELIAIDPGPFSAELAEALGILPRNHPRAAAPILGIVGSTNETAAGQLAQLISTSQVSEVAAQLTDAGGILDIDAGSAALRHALETSPVGQNVVLTIAKPDADAASFSSAQAQRASQELATIARNGIGDRPLGGIFCSGGDTASAFLDRWQANGVEVDAEIAPLTVAGRIRGGPLDGLPIVTKGGAVGDVNAIVTCFEYLERSRTSGINSEKVDSNPDRNTQEESYA